MAYVLGFFMADGYMTLHKNGGKFINIQITDKKLLYDIQKAFGSNHTIGIRKGKGNENTLYRLQMGSKEMYNDLLSLGVQPNKTKNMKIPTIPKGAFCHFVRGYFDGDGHVWYGLIHKERKTHTFAIATYFTSCSVGFLEDLKDNLISFGFKGGSIHVYKAGYARLQLSIKDSLKLSDFMYNRLDSSKLYLVRKKKVFDEYKQKAAVV